MRTFILADNQDITRKGIMALLKQEQIADVILEVKNLHDLQLRLSDYPTAVVVVDYTLFDFYSQQQMLIVKAKAKESSWLLFCEDVASPFIRYVMFSDPTFSFVMKHDSLEDITIALRNTAYNLSFVCESVELALQESVPPPPVIKVLTDAEVSVLRGIARGKTTKEIAWEKNLSFHTINAHRKNIFRKLEINNVQEAVQYAIRAGLLDDSEYEI